ncbi:MAG TPA: GTPase, partial [Acetobacteraceae bacterium]|nr:GTPase [Acetobacteraceae bacterium]
ITGPPNVGKSSLVNALADRDVAIVSPIPGTTRDALEARVVLGGVPVTLVDTAGLREAADVIEAEGIRRAHASVEKADIVIAMVTAGDSAPVDPPDDRRLLVANKADLGGTGPDGAIRISVLTGEGMPLLRDCLAAKARVLTESLGPPPLTRARHRASLQDALERLTAAERATLPELRGEDLRLAMRALGRITGQVGVEDILDTLFRQFCIGK